MEFFEEIVEEIRNVEKTVDCQQVTKIVSEIKEARHIFLSGAGRSGLMIKAFANRLLHLGFSVSLVGEISSPHTKKGDLLLISSGSGSTASLVSQVKIANKNKIRVGLFTTDPNSQIGKLADTIIVVPAQSKKVASNSLQPMGSLFEQSTLILFDSIILMLMKEMGETNENMLLRHADLE